MTATIEQFLLWSVVIHFGILLYWFLMIVFGSELIYKMHSKWYKINKESFFKIHYKGLIIYKLAIFTLFGVPYIIFKWILN